MSKRGVDGRMRIVAATTLLLLLSVLVAGVALTALERNRPARSPISNGPTGRPIGAEQSAEGLAIDTALRFTRGYLSHQRGRLPASRIPSVTSTLRKTVAAQRVPLASQDRRTAVVGAMVERLTGASARVTVTVGNITESFTYPLPLDLVRRDGAWVVQSIPDDF